LISLITVATYGDVVQTVEQVANLCRKSLVPND
jgi:hypothetical protein